MHIATKAFLDGQGRQINVGDELPDDYDKPTIEHYKRYGMIADGAPAKKTGKTPAPKETKPAGPQETKAVVGPANAQAAGVQGADPLLLPPA